MNKNEIKTLIETNKVVLFMKGTPQFPQCGFSQKVCQILKTMNVEFISKNVLEDDILRENIKSFSHWPTIPQLYVNGQFIGGCDIVTEMYKDGSLKPYFESA